MDLFEERLARIGADVEAARVRAAAASTFRQGAGQVRGRGSRDGVEVIVDSAGAVIDVGFGRELAWLREPLLAAYRDARRDAGRAVMELAADSFGAEDPSISRLRGSYGLDEDETPPGHDSRRTSGPHLGIFRPGDAR